MRKILYVSIASAVLISPAFAQDADYGQGILRVPNWNTAGRKTNQTGTLGYNKDTGKIEWWDGNNWNSPASSGANSDITSLNGLTTPLKPTQGGCGSTSGLGCAQNLSLPYVVCEGAPTSATIVSTVASPVTTETNLVSCLIPANSVSTNGQLSVLVKFTYNPSGNTDVNTMRIRQNTVSGIGGTQYMNISSSTTTLKNYKQQADIAYNGNTQIGDPNGAGTGSWGASSGTPSSGTLNIASDSYINITGQIGTPTGNDQLSLAYYRVVIYPSAGN